jgi:hypothetical protein
VLLSTILIAEIIVALGTDPIQNFPLSDAALVRLPLSGDAGE